MFLVGLLCMVMKCHFLEHVGSCEIKWFLGHIVET